MPINMERLTVLDFSSDGEIRLKVGTEVDKKTLISFCNWLGSEQMEIEAGTRYEFVFKDKKNLFKVIKGGGNG